MDDFEEEGYFSGEQLFKEVPEKNKYMQMAKEYARLHSLDKAMPTGSVCVADNIVIGIGANGSNYHDTHACERVKQKIPTGQGYELCEGCHPKNHSESRAIANAKEKGFNPSGADLYLWGHWWCCRWCRESILKAGIPNVYLVKGSECLFNKNNPKNIIGRQFQM